MAMDGMDDGILPRARAGMILMHALYLAEKRKVSIDLGEATEAFGGDIYGAGRGAVFR